MIPAVHGVRIGVGAFRVEDLVAVHDGDEVLGVREVDDVVGIARKHYHAPDPVAADLVFKYLRIAVFVQLVGARVLGAHPDKPVALHYDELLPLAVVPVPALGDARSAYVYADLAAASGMDQFRERAPRVTVHLQVEHGPLLRQVAEERAVEPLREAVRGDFRDEECVRHLVELMEKFHYLAERHPVGHRTVAVAARLRVAGDRFAGVTPLSVSPVRGTAVRCLSSSGCMCAARRAVIPHPARSRDDGQPVELAAVLAAMEGLHHLVHEVVDVQHLKLHRRVADGYRQPVRDVVAERRYRAVVVRPAPLAVQVREAVHQHLHPVLLAVAQEEVLASLLAAAVFAVAEPP